MSPATYIPIIFLWIIIFILFRNQRKAVILRKIIEKLFWHYQERKNWQMKMDEPIAIKKLSREEAEKILEERRRKDG